MGRDRQLELDGIRGFAALSVLIYHARYLPNGGLGVDVFFVLSGYLITGILHGEIERTGEVNLGGFLLRRARRLGPALALLLIAYAALCPLLFPQDMRNRWLDILAAALYLTDFREGLVPSLGPLFHTWSLAVEAQFYLLWPLVLLALRPLGRDRAAWAILAAWVLISAARVLWLALGHSPDFAYFTAPFHATGLLLGSALALKPAARLSGWWGLTGLALLLFAPHTQFGWTIPLAEVCAVVLIASPPRFLAAKPLVFLGMISYGIYLWHIPIWRLLGQHRDPMTLAELLTFSILAATTSYFGLEQWFLRRHREPVLSRPALAGRTAT